MNSSGRTPDRLASAYPEDTIECHGGPYDGHVYFVSDWEGRKLAQEHMKAHGSTQSIGALDYAVRKGHAYFTGQWKQHVFKAPDGEEDDEVRAASQRW